MGFVLLLKSDTRAEDEKIKRAYPAPAAGNPRPMGFVLLLKSDTRVGDEKIKRA